MGNDGRPHELGYAPGHVGVDLVGWGLAVAAVKGQCEPGKEPIQLAAECRQLRAQGFEIHEVLSVALEGPPKLLGLGVEHDVLRRQLGQAVNEVAIVSKDVPHVRGVLARAGRADADGDQPLK